MKGLHQAVGLGGHDGAGIKLTVWSKPVVQEPREDEDPAVNGTDEEGSLGLAGGLPLEEPAGGDEAPAMAQGTPEHRLGADALGPGVEGLGACLRIL